jgi:uncharacterized protein
MKVISNSSPLIHLASVGDLDLLRQLFRRIIIPPAVHAEVVERGGDRAGALEVGRAVAEGWITVAGPPLESETQHIMSEHVLERGESEAIALAVE